MALKWGFYGRKAEMASPDAQAPDQNPGESAAGVFLHRHHRVTRSWQERHGHGRNRPNDLFLFELPQNETPPDGDAVDGRWLYDETCLKLMHALLEEARQGLIRPQLHKKGI